MSTFTFTWPAGPTEVYVTGTFDAWSKSIPLVKGSDGSFSATVPLPKEKVLYKYVVDGNWVCSDTQKKEDDGNGNINNVLTEEDLVTESLVPEAGGAISATASAAVAAAAEKEPEFKPTVMPKEEKPLTTMGEPGLVVPKNPEEISAFKEISTVDAKTLNRENEEPAAPAAAVVIPEKPEEISAFKEVSTVDAKKLNEAEPEAVKEEAKKVVKEAKEESKKAAKEEPKKAAKEEPKIELKKPAEAKLYDATNAPSATPTAAPASSSVPPKKKGFFSKLKRAFK